VEGVVEVRMTAVDIKAAEEAVVEGRALVTELAGEAVVDAADVRASGTVPPAMGTVLVSLRLKSHPPIREPSSENLPGTFLAVMECRQSMGHRRLEVAATAWTPLRGQI